MCLICCLLFVLRKRKQDKKKNSLKKEVEKVIGVDSELELQPFRKNGVGEKGSLKNFEYHSTAGSSNNVK
jgi:hypothetical protein